MNREPKLFFEHILESIDLIEDYTRDVTKDEFLKSVRLQDMVIRRLEIIGEAVKNLPEDLKKVHKEIPWKRIAGMRDKLIHDYFGQDLNLTWMVIEKELPALKQHIIEIMGEQ